MRRIVGAYSVLGVFIAFKGEILPAWLQEKLQLIALIGLLLDLPTSWLIIGFLLILLLITLEESYQTIRALQPNMDTTALARCRADGVQVFARRVTTIAEKQQWMEDNAASFERAMQCLTSFPEPTRLRFEHLGSLKAGRYADSYDNEHDHRRLILARQLEILQDIITETERARAR